MKTVKQVALLPESATVEHKPKHTSQYSTHAVLPITLLATPILQGYARYITEGRQHGKQFAAPSASIGTPAKDFEATYYGTLAELVLYQWLEGDGGTPSYTLLDRMPVTKPDFVMNGIAYEIKCSPPGKKYLAISRSQHLNPTRKCEFYILALFETPDTIRFCAPIPHSVIGAWRLMMNGHSPYYSISRASLLAPQERSYPSFPKSVRSDSFNGGLTSFKEFRNG